MLKPYFRIDFEPIQKRGYNVVKKLDSLNIIIGCEIKYPNCDLNITIHNYDDFQQKNICQN